MDNINEKLLKPYDAKETEGRIYKIWEESGFFNPDNLPDERKETYTIVIPPPNVTGSLHMGHALNATIQDILIRQKRMQGYKTLWLPGTDHAGIATQNVVEKKLKKEGLSRHDLGKEKFIEKVWEWKKEHGDIILGQLKKIGASCDWSRTKFTMDDDYAKAVKTAFLHYYEKGWIYQGDRVVNWCTRCQTSLSDLELEYEDEKGKLWYIKYPIKKLAAVSNQPSVAESRELKAESFIIVATTRPETMLGDSAVAVNPKDDRYKEIVGKTALLPIVDREIPIVADRMIELEFGTGAVKITPAHDMLDFEIGERNNLPVHKIINQYGKMTAEAGKEYEGLSVKDAREKVVAELEKLGLIEKIEDYDHRVSKCYRCGRVIEPQISKQWFLKMDELAKKAKEAVKSGGVSFRPERWEKVYFNWMDNVKDWCISRQIWWGHKIPLEGVDDVLDTWFSSALWPFATLGWPDKESSDLKEFFPTQTLSTARDIINLWVARMIFSSYEFMGQRPFSDIIIHPTILTKDGRRMSKSLGTGIDPIGLIEKYGADATRFGIIYQMMGGQDVHFNEDAILAGKKFANKLWNISRFVLQNTDGKIESGEWSFAGENLTEEDKEMMEKLGDIVISANKDMSDYRFGHALHLIYDFVWHDFADKYIEYFKQNKNEMADRILKRALAQTLKLLHPFMPFITEEIWGALPKENDSAGENNNLLIVGKWPEA